MSDNFFTFELIHQSKKSRARTGIIHTPHGPIHTPHFVAVATNATLKAVDSVTAMQLGLELIFCNTYHLIVHPGVDTIAQAGGLHNFMNRPAPIITDSGGFQVFSLAYGTVKEELKSKGFKKHTEAVVKITEDGVLFRSYRDGSPILLTPESSIEAQKKLGADIIIPFDELPPYHIDQKLLERSLHRTHRWEERSLKEHMRNIHQQAIYAVIHGGIDIRLRKLSCDFLTKLPFDGYAIGGSLGKNREEMLAMLCQIMPDLPADKPNHLLGIADIESVDACIRLGIDTFDSCHPMRCARHGLLFSSRGDIKVKQTRYKNCFEPIDPQCTCPTCQNYTLAYIHHLFKAHEITALMLATVHNIAFMVQLMQQYRQAILEDRI